MAKFQQGLNGIAAKSKVTIGDGACFFRAVARSLPQVQRDELYAKYLENQDAFAEQIAAVFPYQEDYPYYAGVAPDDADLDDKINILDENNEVETAVAFMLRQQACDYMMSDANLASSIEIHKAMHDEGDLADYLVAFDSLQGYRNANTDAQNDIITALGKLLERDIVIIRPHERDSYRVGRIHCREAEQRDTVVKSPNPIVVYYDGAVHYEYVQHQSQFNDIDDGQVLISSVKAAKLNEQAASAKKACALKEDVNDTKDAKDAKDAEEPASGTSELKQKTVKPTPKVVDQPVKPVKSIFESIKDFFKSISSAITRVIKKALRV